MAKRSKSTGSSQFKHGDKKRHKQSFSSSNKVNRGKKEVVFDPEARKAYLRGFSDRKKERRAFGLAMQKVKDRKAKLEERKEAKKEDIKRIEEAEQQKELFLKQVSDTKDKDNDHKNDLRATIDADDNEADEVSSVEDTTELLDTKMYDDQATSSHWGGRVTVTTAAVNLDEGDSSADEIDDSEKPFPKKSFDRRQIYAGNVEKFMSQLKGAMPSKKKTKDSGQPTRRKGKNGAADMKGIGGAATLKLAQKVLTKAKAKQGPASSKGRKGGKRSRR